MNLSSLIPSWVFFTLVLVNVLLGISSIIMGHFEMAVLNGLSAACCYIGYRVSLISEKDK